MYDFMTMYITKAGFSRQSEALMQLKPIKTHDLVPTSLGYL